jgi:hypothetical protein
MRLTVIGGLAAIAIALIACGGGSKGSVKYATVEYGSVKYAATVVLIGRPDLSSAALSGASIANPPHADQYPAVVAEVNGKPITGKQLATEQVGLELSRRNLLKTTPDALPPGYVNSQLREARSADPFKIIIDDELERQAVERLGLSPTHDEAVTYTRQLEAIYDQGLALVSPDQRTQQIDLYQQEGFPATDWASDDRIVEQYGALLGLRNLARQVCPKYETPVPAPTLPPEYLGFVNISAGRSCAAFLAQERKSADIVYYVRWED